MKKILLTLSCLSLLSNLKAQEITLDKIYSGKYIVEYLDGISSRADGEHYTMQNQDGISEYSYQTFEKTKDIVKGNFQNYTFSPDEKKILLQIESIPIYRHSFLGKFEIKDLENGQTIALNNGNFVQEPLFSPDGTKVAFISENNLYYQDLKTNQIVQITNDGKKNFIINGLSDWVYEEEFGHARQYEWNKAGDAILFVKFDESNVPEVSLPIYKKNLYPEELKYKYPKAGENNSVVSLFLYQLKDQKQVKLDLSSFENYYIPKLFKTQKNNELVVGTSNRHQNKVDILKVDTNDFSVKKLFSEEDKAWIETSDLELDFLEDNSMLWVSERDGYQHVYWYDSSGKLKKKVTDGAWEVTKYYGFSPKTKEIFVQTTQKGSINRVISKFNILTGKGQIISDLEGTNDANFSKNFHYYIDVKSSSKEPYQFILKNENGKTLKELKNNHQLLSNLEKDNWVQKEYFTIKGVNEMNAWVMKPKNFDKHKKYPLLMYQYSGPGSQQVSNSWEMGNFLWFNSLVQKGFIVACVDGRGTGFKGAQYKKSTYLNLGKYEIEDQIFAAKWFANQEYIDANRIGIFGWSFGGYMTSLAMTKGADTFKLGIAVAPVTNWKFYDSIYTERFLRTPEENPDGYSKNSPTEYASLMKGKYLLIHGSADDNVHLQNSMEFSQALIQNNKTFEMMVYPDKNHGIYGGNTRKHLYEKMTKFILDNL